MSNSPRFAPSLRSRRLAVTAGVSLLAALSVCSSAVAGNTEPETQAMSPIIVTATRLPTPASSVASSFTLITAEEIDERQYRTVNDALRSVPGLNLVQLGGPGTATSIFVRGTESNHVLFLVNGRRVGDPAGSGGVFDPQSLLVDNIERIEIVRGPRSVLYGSDAIGGVINVITKRARGPLTGSAHVEAGSFRTVSGRWSLGGDVGPVTMQLNLAKLRTDGISIAPDDEGNPENDGFRDDVASLALGFSPADGVTVDLYGQYVRAVTEIDNFGADDVNSEDSRTIRLAQIDVGADLIDDLWHVRLTGGFNDQDFQNDNPPESGVGETSRSIFDGTIMETALLSDFDLARVGTLVLGLEARREQGKSSGGAFFNFDDQLRTYSAFAEYQFEFVERVFGTLGVRGDNNRDYESETTYGASLGYRHLETATTVRASAGTGFKAPSLIDLFGGVTGLFIGNPELVPEKSFGWDAGVEQELFAGRLALGATYFENDIDELIDGFAFDAATGLFTARNVDEATTRGVETFVEVQPLPDLSLALDYTFTRAFDSAINEDLLRRPKHKASANLIWFPLDSLTVNFATLYTGSTVDVGGVRMASYTVVDVSAAYDLGDGMRLQGRVENLFDRDYEIADGFAQPGIAGMFGVGVDF
jgi:vitamin B12 transporter